MAYRTLKSIFHQRDRAGADAEERARRDSPAAVHWDLLIGEHSTFALMTPEVAALIERIMSFEPKIRAEWNGLPALARTHYLHRMVIDEIQATNEIEQVRSTRKEISEAIEMVWAEQPLANKRFAEMVRLYLNIGNDQAESPQTLDDIRDVYDAVTRGEIRDEDAPDGKRFRQGPVSITSGIKVVHTGVVPESAIDDALTLMLSQGGDDSIPRLIRQWSRTSSSSTRTRSTTQRPNRTLPSRAGPSTGVGSVYEPGIVGDRRRQQGSLLQSIL